MINLILGIMLAVWCFIKRVSYGGKVEGKPLGLPRGSIKAYITLLIITFPFHYIVIGGEVPGLVINAIFVLVLFYFETRKAGKPVVKLHQIIQVIKDEWFGHKRKQEKNPLYLPKYSVRISIIVALVVIFLIIPIGTYETTTTLLDLIIIIGLFIIGQTFGGVANYKTRQRIKDQIEVMENYKSLSDVEIIENLMEKKPSLWKEKGLSILSYVIFLQILI